MHRTGPRPGRRAPSFPPLRMTDIPKAAFVLIHGAWHGVYPRRSGPTAQAVRLHSRAATPFIFRLTERDPSPSLFMAELLQRAGFLDGASTSPKVTRPSSTEIGPVVIKEALQRIED